MTAYNNFGQGFNNYGGSQYPQNISTVAYQPFPNQNKQLDYVHGIEGANAFQMPPGVTKVVLWDTDVDSFYIKMLDEMGRPKVVAWKDFTDHVEPEEKTPEETKNLDMDKYLTKDDLLNTLDKLGFSDLLTKQDLDKALKELTVGVGGRVVRTNELD